MPSATVLRYFMAVPLPAGAVDIQSEVLLEEVNLPTSFHLTSIYDHSILEAFSKVVSSHVTRWQLPSIHRRRCMAAPFGHSVVTWIECASGKMGGRCCRLLRVGPEAEPKRRYAGEPARPTDWVLPDREGENRHSAAKGNRMCTQNLFADRFVLSPCMIAATCCCCVCPCCLGRAGVPL